MKGLSIFFLAIVALASGCKKDDGPDFTSPEGDWTYTTPDGEIGVDFKITKSGDDFTVTGTGMRVDGQDCKFFLQASNVAATSIGSIRINANDTKVTYAYPILFTDIEISGDFKEMKVPGGSYTWPHDKTNDLTDIVIKRK